MKYIAFIHKDSDSDYGISFPDFPGCISAGETLAEARANGLEALQAHMEMMAESDMPIPDPTDIDTAMQSDIAAGAIMATEIDATPPTKVERINITGRADHIAAIDRAAAAAHKSRSEFMIDASLGKIKEVRGNNPLVMKALLIAMKAATTKEGVKPDPILVGHIFKQVLEELHGYIEKPAKKA